MDRPVKYKIEFEPSQLAYVGELLDKQPHGQVSKIVADIQVQITTQDSEEKQRQQAQAGLAREQWFTSEHERRSAAAQADKPKAKRDRSSKKGN